MRTVHADNEISRNDVLNLSDNTHVRIKIYQKFYHYIIYIANEGCHFRIKEIIHRSQYCIVSFNMGLWILVF